MKVEISDPSLIGELAEALRRCEFTVARTDARTLTVSPEPFPPGVGSIHGAAELELDLYLKVWEAKHPGARATRVKTQ